MSKTRLLLVLLLYCLTSTVMAQRERNYIYLLDCTKSMTGYGKNNPAIWEPTKDYLRKELGNHTAGTTLHVIPFQGSVLEGIHCQAEELDWQQVEKTIDGYVENVTNTNICDAWDAIDAYIDTHKDNYIILLTDGQDNVNGMEALAEKLRRWCGKYPNTYAFYVLLTKAAVDQKIAEIINGCDNEFVVDATKGIPVFGGIEGGLVIYANTLNLKKTYKLNFSSVDEYAAKAVCSDPYFDVKVEGGKINGGIIPIRLEARKPIKEINKTLPEQYEFTFDVEAEVINILNPTVRVVMTNKSERTLETLAEETDMGTARWYDSFLFMGASEQEQLEVDLQAVFNDEALKEGAAVELTVGDPDGGDDYHLLFNGEPVENGRIALSAGQTDKSLLSVVFDPDAREGSRYLELKPVAKRNLDNINDQRVEEYTLTLRAKYHVGWNPLKTILMWVAIILLTLLLLWMLIIRRLVYPPISVKSIQINDPYFSKVNVKGARRVVFTNKTEHQGLLSRLFTGEILYKKNEIWTSPLAFEAGSKKRTLRVVRTKDYTFDPFTSQLKAPNDYMVESTDGTTKVSMTIN